MKRQTQQTGVRDWYGGDILGLQEEPLKVLDGFFGNFGSYIVAGCNITANGSKYAISPGLVVLGGTGENGEAIKIVAPFAGVASVSLPVYLSLSKTVEEDLYNDGEMKPIIYNYTATATNVRPPSGDCIEISAVVGSIRAPRFVDMIQDASHRFITDTERANWRKIESFLLGATGADTLSSLLGRLETTFTSAIETEKRRATGVESALDTRVTKLEQADAVLTSVELLPPNSRLNANTSVASQSAGGWNAVDTNLSKNGDIVYFFANEHGSGLRYHDLLNQAKPTDRYRLSFYAGFDQNWNPIAPKVQVKVAGNIVYETILSGGMQLYTAAFTVPVTAPDTFVDIIFTDVDSIPVGPGDTEIRITGASLILEATAGGVAPTNVEYLPDNSRFDENTPVSATAAGYWRAEIGAFSKMSDGSVLVDNGGGSDSVIVYPELLKNAGAKDVYRLSAYACFGQGGATNISIAFNVNGVEIYRAPLSAESGVMTLHAIDFQALNISAGSGDLRISFRDEDGPQNVEMFTYLRSASLVLLKAGESADTTPKPKPHDYVDRYLDALPPRPCIGDRVVLKPFHIGFPDGHLIYIDQYDPSPRPALWRGDYFWNQSKGDPDAVTTNGVFTSGYIPCANRQYVYGRAYGGDTMYNFSTSFYTADKVLISSTNVMQDGVSVPAGAEFFKIAVTGRRGGLNEAVRVKAWTQGTEERRLAGFYEYTRDGWVFKSAAFQQVLSLKGGRRMLSPTPLGYGWGYDWGYSVKPVIAVPTITIKRRVLKVAEALEGVHYVEFESSINGSLPASFAAHLEVKRRTRQRDRVNEGWVKAHRRLTAYRELRACRARDGFRIKVPQGGFVFSLEEPLLFVHDGARTTLPFQYKDILDAVFCKTSDVISLPKANSRTNIVGTWMANTGLYIRCKTPSKFTASSYADFAIRLSVKFGRKRLYGDRTYFRVRINGDDMIVTPQK